MNKPFLIRVGIILIVLTAVVIIARRADTPPEPEDAGDAVHRVVEDSKEALRGVAESINDAVY